MKNKIESQEDRGKILLSWEFPERAEYQRGKSWYFGAIIIFVAVFIYSIITANYLFSIILILFGLIYFFHSKERSLMVKIKIYEDGVMVGSKFYDWEEIKSFSLIYKPHQTQRLYFDLKNTFLSDFSIPLEGENPLKVRNILKQYLDEDLEKIEETMIDRLNRWLKI